MKHEEPNAYRNSYDAVEDAIDLSKKDPTKTWDDLAGTAPEQKTDKSEQDEDNKTAPRAGSHKPRRA